jgi:GNAT superfamily N-acetyltransferase
MAAGRVTIRAAGPADLPLLVEIERRAGRVYAEHGLPEIAADDPGTAEELEPYRAAGAAWVAADKGDLPVAYILTAEIDDGAHIEQVSVDPDHAGHGIGAALIDHVAAVAAAAGLRALTLTTFRDIPWNAPYYARLGFVELPEAGWGPQLRALVALERHVIPSDAPRLAMIRPLA